MSRQVTAYIALGSNLGDRQANIRQALALLAATPGVQVGEVSPLLENPAVGGPADAPAFLNAAARILTTLGPDRLLGRLHEIEASLGRVRRLRWEPRTIDLDLLLYGDRTIQRPDLAVPHPRMHQRRFVLLPLSQIAPQAIHPLLGRTVVELLAEYSATGSSRMMEGEP